MTRGAHIFAYDCRSEVKVIWIHSKRFTKIFCFFFSQFALFLQISINKYPHGSLVTHHACQNPSYLYLFCVICLLPIISLCVFRSLVFPCVLGSAVFSLPLIIDCIIPQVFLIVCRIYPNFLCYLNPSLPMILWQFKMYPVSFVPVFICKISWFNLFCVPQHLISDSVFCFVWTSCFWTPLRISTSPFGLPFYCVERIGLTFGFDSLLVTRITNWIISVETVCWEKDPISGHSLCS